MSEYENLKQEYETARNDLEPRIWLKARHVVTGQKFVRELAHLAGLTGDLRFVVALEAIRDNDLVDEELGFRKNTFHHLFAPAYKEWDDWAFVIVEENLREGVSLRIACARAASELRLEANSFEAAIKDAERTWRKYKAGGKELERVLEDIFPGDRMLLEPFRKELESRESLVIP
jgi:hypothetical protein